MQEVLVGFVIAAVILVVLYLAHRWADVMLGKHK
jgi:hypothetical protein